MSDQEFYVMFCLILAIVVAGALLKIAASLDKVADHLKEIKNKMPNKKY
jgi:hypothetical protein